MIEGLISIIGLCITFCPPFVYFHYLLEHVNKKTRFDYHVELVNEKKGKFGVYFAYLERILFGALVCSLGILLSEYFRNETILKIFVILFIVYVIIKYFDEKNEK